MDAFDNGIYIRFFLEMPMFIVSYLFICRLISCLFCTFALGCLSTGIYLAIRIELYLIEMFTSCGSGPYAN